MVEFQKVVDDHDRSLVDSRKVPDSRDDSHKMGDAQDSQLERIESREAAFFNKRTPEQLLWILSASDAPGKLCTNRQHLIEFLAADFHNVCQAKAFVYICNETLRALLLSPHLRCDHAEDAVRAVARWVRFDSENRKRYLDALIPILPHDVKHPLRSRAAIVSNWDVYHHAHKHSTRHHHYSHNRHHKSDGSTSTVSSGHTEEHHKDHHTPFHFHLHRPSLHLPHLHRPHLPGFMHRNASSPNLQGKLAAAKLLDDPGDENVISPMAIIDDGIILEKRTMLGDRIIEKRSSLKHRDIEIHTRT